MPIESNSMTFSDDLHEWTVDPQDYDSQYYHEDEAITTMPIVAIVGHPNVGKSTLVNRILGRREAVVQDRPGVTRDRVSYPALWSGRHFLLQDTGGWQLHAHGLEKLVAEQASVAMTTADVIVMVVDGQIGATSDDEHVARLLRSAHKPILLAVNKVDNHQLESDTATLWKLGLGQPYPISALHGRGVADLLDEIIRHLPTELPQRSSSLTPRRVAIVGKPNVGKSSLLNRLTGDHRSVVHESAGTTVDPVDSLVTLEGQQWQFVDTAGLRRKVAHARGQEFYAASRTRAAIDAAEVVLVLIDASCPLTEQDQRLLGMVIDSGRAVVMVFNKWDLVDEDRRIMLEREIDRDLSRLRWAPRVNISAQTGRAVHKLLPALRLSLQSWDQRISTGLLNTWIRDVIAATPPPARSGRIPRVLFATQASSCPPTFILFTTGFLEAGYRRFLERKLREDFSFEGSPIRIYVRQRRKHP